MNQRRLDWHIAFSPPNGKFDVWLGVVDPISGRRSLATNVTFKDIEPGEYVEPALRISDADAVALMDALYAAGVRPTSIGSVGQLAATERHLEDMRALVFKRSAP